MKRRSHLPFHFLKRLGRSLFKRNHSSLGFTLLEVLVVVILIGIIFAIAAPGWDAFLSRQRVNTGREQVFQAIRQTQSKARTTRTPQVLLFDSNPGAMPRVGSRSLAGVTALPVDPTTVGDWKSLGSSGEIASQQAALLTIRSNSPVINNRYYQLVFDSTGAVAEPATVSALAGSQFNAVPNSNLPGFAITVARAGASGNGTYRCVIVNTLLGATRLAEKADCP
jgi:prepilin-type N-terminal cleavage/methylation domain-containing protein